MIDHSPLRLVAIRLFTESFGDLFSVRGKITLFEKSLIEGAYEILWLDGLDETPNASWKQTVRAAFRIIDNGALNEPQLVWESYISIVNDIVPLLQKCFERRRFFKQKATDDDLIEGLLSSYKSIYEGLLPTILAPSIYAFGLINDPNEKSFKPKHDGRISFSAIKKMERWVRPPHNRLAIGLNNHVRNAYSHERYRILDGERVELYDVNPGSGKIVWGPEIWTTEQLTELCDKIWVNSLAIICALALYGINSRELAKGRGWGEPASSPALREQDYKRMLKLFGDEASFDLKGYSRNAGNLQIILAVRARGIDQDEKVYLRGNNWGRGFTIAVKYVDVRIVEQVVRCLQRVVQYLDDPSAVVTVSVIDSAGEQIGELRTTKHVIETLGGRELDIARKRFELDTFGDEIMQVRTEGVPIEM